MSPTIIECTSAVERVTVHARGALITRRVTLPEALPEGAVELRVPGVTALAEAGSVRAECEGDREIVALRAHLTLPEIEVKKGSLAEAVVALRLERRRLEAEERRLAELRAALAQAALDPGLSRWAKQLDASARFADAIAVSGLFDREIAGADAALREVREARAKNDRDRAAAEIAAAQGGPAEVLGEEQARLEVRLLLAAGAGAVRALAIEYVCWAARWWPAYSARFSAAATEVSLELDALVAQATGEDWRRVRVALSTAHLSHDARLPELPSLRLGRAQPAPKRAYRPPPEGLAALFAGYDRAAADSAVDRREKGGRVETVSVSAPPEDAPAELDVAPDFDRDESMMTRAPTFGGAPLGQSGAVAAPMAAPMPSAPQMKRRAMPAKSAGLMSRIAPESAAMMDGEERKSEGGRGGGGPSEPAAPAAIEPADAWLDFDALRLADPADHDARGHLVRDRRAGSSAAADRARARIDGLTAPHLARDPESARGRFDHRYDAEGTADVPSNGVPQRVTVASAEATSTPRFVAVPREAAEVYREAEIKNPLEAPLLSGPVDIFLDGALLRTSELGFVDRGGSMRLGLGVEDRLRVARNARVDESTAGLLGGSLVVDHAITIELASSLARPVRVEVLERVPISDFSDVEVKITHTRPEPQKYTQAERGSPLRRGLSFTVELPAGDKAKIELGYRVTLSAKNEIVGGNRRD